MKSICWIRERTRWLIFGVIVGFKGELHVRLLHRFLKLPQGKEETSRMLCVIKDGF
jgi:hypothetical protein